MYKKRKYDFVVCNDRSLIRLFVFFFIIFIVLVSSNINLYVVEKNKIGVLFLVSIILIIFFGAISFFYYYIIAEKIYVVQDKIIIKTWYGLKKRFKVDEIDKVFFKNSFENRKKKIIIIKIVVNKFSRQCVQSQNNFDEFVEFLSTNIDKEKWYTM